MLRQWKVRLPAVPRWRLQVPVLCERQLSVPAKLSELRLLLKRKRPGFVRRVLVPTLGIF